MMSMGDPKMMEKDISDVVSAVEEVLKIR